MIAADLMTENPRTIGPNDTIAEAVEALQSLDVRHLPVVDDDDNLVGMLSDRDLGPLVRTFAEGADGERMVLPLSRQRVADLMSSDVVCVDADAELEDVVATMLEQRIGAVPVVDGEGNVVGIISYVDVLRTLAHEERPRPTRARGAHAR